MKTKLTFLNFNKVIRYKYFSLSIFLGSNFEGRYCCKCFGFSEDIKLEMVIV